MVEDVKPTIRAFLAQSFPGRPPEDHEDIFSLGFVNSLFAMKLVLFLEREFKIQIGQEDLDLDHFRSVNAMQGFVARKRR
jgi:methoxymalonate biosynthesis acyl carrier protein